jgi:hypothetical protein
MPQKSVEHKMYASTRVDGGGLACPRLLYGQDMVNWTAITAYCDEVFQDFFQPNPRRVHLQNFGP